MRVAAADQAELVGVGAEFLLQFQAVLVGRAEVFKFEHVLRLRNAAIEIALIPDLEIGELVIRRQERVRLAGALGLGRFIEALPFRARFDIAAIEFLAEGLDGGNIKPLLRLPLCAIARTLPPVFCS